MFGSLPLSSRLIGLALVATALVAVPVATAAEATTSGTMYGAPKAGTCYSVSAKVAQTQSSTTATAHSCRKAHTLWVFATSAVPTSIDITDPSNTALGNLVLKVCRPKLTDKIGTQGRNWGLSSYEWYAFFPTKQQQDHGARWFTCELGIYAGQGRLATTSLAKPARLSMHPEKLFQNCATATYYWTNCAAKHAYRATYTQVFTAASGGVDAKAESICRKHMRGHTWVYGAKVLNRTRWVAVCSIKTHH